MAQTRAAQSPPPASRALERAPANVPMNSDKLVPATTFLGHHVHVHIDRPLGSRHPDHGFIYLLNYGFVPHTPAPDGEDLDAYVLGVFEPLETFTGVCCAVLHRLDDDDDKLILTPEGKHYTDEQILALTEFQERFFCVKVIRAEE